MIRLINVFDEHLVLYPYLVHVNIVFRSQSRVCNPEKVLRIFFLPPAGQLELVPEPALEPIILDNAENGKLPPLLSINILDGSPCGQRRRPL